MNWARQRSVKELNFGQRKTIRLVIKLLIRLSSNVKLIYVCKLFKDLLIILSQILIGNVSINLI